MAQVGCVYLGFVKISPDDSVGEYNIPLNIGRHDHTRADKVQVTIPQANQEHARRRQLVRTWNLSKGGRLLMTDLESPLRYGT